MVMDDIASRAAPKHFAAGSVDVDVEFARPAPKAIQCVLPVWGRKFVHQFLDLGLATLLAPGNVPALAEALPTRFIILTKFEDECLIRQHRAFRQLCEVCPTEIRLIDHLITGSNYSTTLTLGYTEVVRATGAEMLDTCFFFLVSDYVIADGSLRSVLHRMLSGKSGVLVGNFNVVLEDALPWLQERLNRSTDALAMHSREMLQWAFNYLHPTTVANTVNIPFNHNTHTNRLFWRVDGRTLLARFYLMHMICVRPETTQFIIGSSCDYSFIPEMCPSDNVEVITDSDDYLVVEMQPRTHESRFLKSGPLRTKALAKSLSSWTTARHRENSHYSVVFHAGPLSSAYAEAAAQAERFIGEVGAFLKWPPKPHRDHPYWRGAIAAYREATGRKLAFDDWRRVLGLPDRESDDSWAGDWLVEKMHFALFGRLPKVRLYHPRWPDYHFIQAWLDGFLRASSQRLLLASDVPTVFTASLADSGERVVRVLPSLLLADAAETWEPMAESFDLCLVELSENDAKRGADIVDRIAPMMKNGGEMLIVIYNRRGKDGDGFGASIAFNAPLLLRPATTLIEAHYVPATRLRWSLQRIMTGVGRMAHSKPFIGIPLIALAGAFLALGSLLANAATLGRTTARLRPGKIATSFASRLRIDAAMARAAQAYTSHGIERQRRRSRPGLPTVPGAKAWHWEPGRLPYLGDRRDSGRPVDLERPPNVVEPGAGPPDGAHKSTPAEADQRQVASAGSRDVTREPQYMECVEVRDRHGLASLGLMTNQVWHDDPRRVTFTLARYKFVAKMLSGCDSVAEVGCGDAFGSRIVLQEVNCIDVYDLDPVFIDDIRQRHAPDWPLAAAVHDIVVGPLPKQYNGIFSLDVIEHISSADEPAYLANLSDSLRDNGVLILGSPSLESQQYASPQSKVGHVNCKSGRELKALMERYFHNVFLFSMNDEVVHTGFYPMAHYLIAVCCGKKSWK